jgi:hypothetical protein
VKFDDVAVGLHPATRERFGSYGEAIVHFLRELDRRVKSFDPSCRLVYLPQCYTSRSAYRGFARAIRAAGGLPEDAALCWTGPEVISPVIPAEDVREYLEAFGAKTGLLYDNHLREGDFAPLRGRKADLVPLLVGVFSERSSRLTRMTRCDWNWNPEAYDPDRALKLACRETAERDPAAYRALLDLVRALDTGPAADGRLPRAERIARLRVRNAAIRRRLPPLEKAMGSGRSAVARIRKTVEKRLRKQALLEASGYREAVAVRATSAVVVDGVANEAAWHDARPLDEFVTWTADAWNKLGPRMGRPVPLARRTEVRILRDEKALYVTARCRSDLPIAEGRCCDHAPRYAKRHGDDPTWWTRIDPRTRDVNGVWHTPALELFLAPGEDAARYVHLVGNVAGLTYDQRGGEPFGAFDPAWTVAGRVEEDGRSFTIEVAIPFESLGVPAPKPGEVWGFNLARTWPDHQVWSFAWGPMGFHTPEEFGTLRFE